MLFCFSSSSGLGQLSTREPKLMSPLLVVFHLMHEASPDTTAGRGMAGELCTDPPGFLSLHFQSFGLNQSEAILQCKKSGKVEENMNIW